MELIGDPRRPDAFDVDPVYLFWHFGGPTTVPHARAKKLCAPQTHLATRADVVNHYEDFRKMLGRRDKVNAYLNTNTNSYSHPNRYCHCHTG
jgi:hypothetical protein